LRFSGQLLITEQTGQQWIFYLSQGRIVYATGGEHPVRRFRRNLVIYSQLSTHRMMWQHDLASADATSFAIGWEYALLCSWMSHQKITRKQAAQFIFSIIVEVLFDSMQALNVTEQIKPDTSLPTELVLIEMEQAIALSRRLWQAWQNVMLTNNSPNQAPIIRQPDQLQNRKLAQFYKAYIKLLDGQRTLRDLAVHMRQDVIKLASSLMPSIHLGWVQLINVPDLLPPVYQPKKPDKKELIACIDDSPMVHQMMEKLVTSSGYRYLGVEDPLRSTGILIIRKPDLIFLDLVMPSTNGYEICQQLRKLSCFRETPIVILTGNDGFANRLRSNFVGASDFLSKPLDAEKVLNAIHRHLKHDVAPY
jgi:chemotaxis family two-component system response regulator PixG